MALKHPPTSLLSTPPSLKKRKRQKKPSQIEAGISTETTSHPTPGATFSPLSNSSSSFSTVPSFASPSKIVVPDVPASPVVNASDYDANHSKVAQTPVAALVGKKKRKKKRRNSLQNVPPN